MLTFESWWFTVLGRVSFRTRTLPTRLRNGARSYYLFFQCLLSKFLKNSTLFFLLEQFWGQFFYRLKIEQRNHTKLDLFLFKFKTGLHVKLANI